VKDLITLLRINGVLFLILTLILLTIIGSAARETPTIAFILAEVCTALISVGSFLYASSLAKKIPLHPSPLALDPLPPSTPSTTWPGTLWHCLAIFLAIISICFIDTPWGTPACLLIAAVLYLVGRTLNLKLARETGAGFSYRDLKYPAICAAIAILITVVMVPEIMDERAEKEFQIYAETQVAPYGVPPDCARYVLILSRAYDLPVETAARVTAERLRSWPIDEQSKALEAAELWCRFHTGSRTPFDETDH
jgi:hypothetical protein